MALTKVSSSLVSDNAVTSGKIADGGIATADIADVAVTTAKIANNAILTQHIDDGQVTTAQLGADAVTADKIANDAISEEHLDITVITSLSAVTAATGDLLMVADVSDSNNLKKIPVSSILAGTHTGAVNTSGTISSGAITSTGNVLVGNTDSTPYDRTSGNAISLGDGLISSAQSGGNAAIFNRMTNDGSIVGFRKAGSAVGSIGVVGGNNLYINGDTVGLGIGDDNLYPTNAAGASTNGALDIGDSSAKFRNLHLSGTISSGAITSSGALTVNSGTANTSIATSSTDTANWMTMTDPSGSIFFGNSGADYELWVGGAKQLEVTSSNSTFAGSINVTGTITGDDGLSIQGGAGNAYLQVGSNTGSWTWKNYQASHKLALEDSDGTGEVLNFSTSGVATFVGNITTTAEITGGLFKVGSTTVIDGSRNLTNMGNVNGAAGAFGSLTVDNFTLNNTTLALSSGDMTLDSAGRIDLSADDNGEIRFFDGSSMYGQIKDDDDRLKIQGLISNKSMLLVGNDNGQEVTMLSLDAEAAGNATFNGTVLASSGTASLPSLSFSTDPNTGIYRAGSDNLGFAIGGQARAFMSGNQFNMTGNGIFSGNGTFGGTLGVTGAATFNAGIVATAASINGQLNVTGTTNGNTISMSQLSTQFDTSSFLRLHPASTTNSGGFTNIFFGTSTSNNFGVAVGGKRAGTNNEPTFAVRMLNDSISGTEVLNINNAGNVRTPGQPFFSVKRSGNQTIAASSWVSIVWNSETTDTGGNFASNIFTAPVAGVYLFTGLVGFNTISATNYLLVRLVCSTAGGIYVAHEQKRDGGGDYGYDNAISEMVTLAAGETVYMSVYAASGGNHTLREDTRWQGRLMG